VGVTGYAIHRATSNGLGPEVGQTGNTSWTDTAVVEGTKYWYAVKARDAAGNASQASALKSIVAYAKPTKPGNFSVSLSSGDPKLTFSASSDNVGVVGYNVYRSTNGTEGPLYAQIAGSPWVDSSAQAGVTYTYAVRARDAAGYVSNATALKSIQAQ
jgi:chitinase